MVRHRGYATHGGNFRFMAGIDTVFSKLLVQISTSGRGSVLVVCLGIGVREKGQPTREKIQVLLGKSRAVSEQSEFDSRLTEMTHSS